MESQDKIMKRFSHNLDQLLVNRKISVNKLAKEIMVSNATVYKYLEGKSVPNLVALMHICEALDISPDTLLLHDIPDENIDLKFESMTLYNDNQLKITANIDKKSLDAIVINEG